MNLLVKSVTTDKGINILNIVLMLVSTVVAFYLPFHTFLFVYAVLGPLHYLTEISWLEKRNFFIAKKWDVLFLIAICILIALSMLTEFGQKKLSPYTSSFMFVSLIYAVFSVFVKNNYIKIIAALLILVFIVRCVAANLGACLFVHRSIHAVRIS
jgi:hypothetical protein